MSNKRVNPFKLKVHLLECEIDEKDKKISDLEEQLKNATKQVRKEVCDKIIKSIHYYPIALLDIDKEPIIKTLGISKEVLDTILKEYQK